MAIVREHRNLLEKASKFARGSLGSFCIDCGSPCNFTPRVSRYDPHSGEEVEITVEKLCSKGGRCESARCNLKIKVEDLK